MESILSSSSFSSSAWNITKYNNKFNQQMSVTVRPNTHQQQHTYTHTYPHTRALIDNVIYWSYRVVIYSEFWKDQNWQRPQRERKKNRLNIYSINIWMGLCIFSEQNTEWHTIHSHRNECKNNSRGDISYVCLGDRCSFMNISFQ